MTKRKPKAVAPVEEVKVENVLQQNYNSRADKVIRFVEKYIIVPEGMLVGQPMVLLPEQKDFIEAVYDNVDHNGRLITRRGFFSVARKNGKTGLISALLGAHLIGPEAKRNSQIYSAARSRDQAALVFRYLAKSLRLNKGLEGLVKITDSGKRIEGLAAGAEYHALAADAHTAHGLSPALSIHDELGQVQGSQDPLYDALESAGGAQSEPLSLIISTQAAGDTDLLSILLDDAIRNPDVRSNVVRLYEAAKDADIWDPAVWRAANFALGIFQNEVDFAAAAADAKRIPAKEAVFRNLHLNQRVSRLSLLIAPSVWKDNRGAIKENIFYEQPVAAGLDLSSTTDLTACVLSCKDPETGLTHVKPFVFTPEIGLVERAKSDRAPYEQWAKEGKIIVLPGRSLDYDMIADYMAKVCKDMRLEIVAFDRWRIDEFKRSAARAGFGQARGMKWSPVGQGMKDMSPRVEKLEHLMLAASVCHGGHPLLNMAAANAIVEMDPAGGRKPTKAKSSARIDPLVAMLMSAYALHVPDEDGPQKPVVTARSLIIV